jgi:hypothetical protein
MNVIELRNPNALGITDIQQLIKRAVESGALLAPGGFDTVAADIFTFVTDPNQFMLLGAEDGAFKSVVLAFLPVGNLFPYPTVVLFYNEGSRALSKATQDKLLDIMLEHGYTRLLAVNSSKRGDKVWQKALTPAGATSNIVGSLALFEVR